MDEIWMPILGGRYEASSLGQIRSQLSGGLVLKQFLDGKGYRCVNPSIDGAKKIQRVHRLVAAAFYGESDLLVRHLNGDAMDNRVENLAYGTTSENRYDAVRHGTDVNTRKTHCPQGHEYNEENTYVTPSRPGRHCRPCNAAAVARYKSRRAGIAS